jgi:hypothetical protein
MIKLFISKNIESINKILFYFSIPMLCISAFRLFMFRIENTFFLEPWKDEIGFLRVYNHFIQKGWYDSVVEGSSPLFNLFSYFFNFFFDKPEIAMRSLGVTSMILIVIIWCLYISTKLNINNKLKIPIYLFLLNVVLIRQSYFTASDDPLFILFLTLSFVSLLIAIDNKHRIKLLFSFSGIFYAFALSTRELFLYYFLGFFVFFVVLLIKDRAFVKSVFLFYLFFGLTVLCIHYPSLKEKGKLSFHNKDFLDKKVAWSELNYLFLLRNEGKLLYGRNLKLKPTPEEVIAFRNQNGENVLPKTYKESFRKMPLSMRINNFLGLFYLQLLPFIRQIGLFFPIFIFFPIFFYYKNKKIEYLNILPLLFYLCFAISLCLTPVVHLEFRWFMMFTLIATVFGILYLRKIFNNETQFFTFILLINMFVISILNSLLQGVW